VTMSLGSRLEQPTTESTITSASYRVAQTFGDISEHGAEKRVLKNFRTPLSNTEEDLANLLSWGEGWDGYEAPQPRRVSINAACEWARELYRDVSHVLWIKPLITADEEGDVVFEWWRGSKKLTVYVSPNTVEYVRVERRGTNAEVTDGDIETPLERRKLWNWLLS
jgi:hypothetical protein